MLGYIHKNYRLLNWLIQVRLLYCLVVVLSLSFSSPTSAQPAITRVEYYIDTDPGYNNATALPFTSGSTDISDATISINPANVGEGVHRLYIRAKSSNGWSLTNRWLFYKPYSGSAPPPPASVPDITLVEYYFDTDPGYGHATALPASAATDLANLIIPVDPATLGEGVHRLYVRAKSSNGWSLTNRWLFYKSYSGSVPPPPASIPDITRIEYYFDTDPGYGNATALPASTVTDLSDLVIPVDPTNMNEGVHRLFVRAKSSNGWSLTNRWLFYKPFNPGAIPPSLAIPDLTGVEYYIDTDPGAGNGTPVAIEPLKEISNSQLFINISNYPVGAHKLYVRAKDKNGSWSLVNEKDFNIAAAQSAPSLIVNSCSRTTICTKDAFSVGHDAIGTFNNGNTFKVFISDASGSFATETEIGAVTDTKSGVIKCNLPVQIGDGSHYKLRVKSSNTSLTGAASEFEIIVTTGAASPSISVTGPAVWCPGQTDTLTASAGEKYLWSTGDTSQTIIVGIPGIYTVNVTNENCSILATANVAPILNSAPVLSFTGVTNFVSEVVSPKSGLPTAIFRFEAKYTDVDGNLPLATYPRLQLDYEGNGSLNDANDRLFYMQEKNANDLDVKDGKDYYFTTAALAESANWKTSFLATDQAGCSSSFGPINGPVVISNPDISIFANDISFSDPKPDISSWLTVYATIRNNSSKDAGSFTVHLVNQFQPNVVYPDITVPGLSSAPNYNTTQVSWMIKTPPNPAWCPMQVFIDYGNNLAEPNELDNQAIRPFTNGKFSLPGDIKITADPNPTVTLVNSSILISGNASYRNTAVELLDPSCAGATVTATLVETGGVGYTYTNANGDYSLNLVAPASPGKYHAKMQITDYTLEGDTTTEFMAEVIVVAPCVGPDLVVAITLSAGTVNTADGGNYILPGDTHTAMVVVTNNGQLTAGTTVLHFELPGGSPVPGDYTIPALAAGESYTVNVPTMTFYNVGTTYFRAYIDYNNSVNECDESNNEAIVTIVVLPPLPDITPYGGPGYKGSSSSYKCDFKSISFAITNIGGIATGPFNARLFMTHKGIQTIMDQTVNSIEPLGLSGVSYDFVPADTGVYNFSLKLDFPEAVTEINELNNDESLDIDMAICLPDLYVLGCGNMNVKPADPVTPGNITINATVFNGGKDDVTTPFNVDFDVAGTHYLALVNSLNVSQAKEVSISVPTILGNNKLIVTSDAGQVIRESVENNNAATGSLCWDFALTNYDCSSPPRQFISTQQYVGRPIKLATGLFNLGLYEANEVKTKFEVSGPGLTGWLDLSFIPSYAGNTCGCPIGLFGNQFAFPEVGTYQVRITADYDNKYVECNETNNVMIVTVTVSNQPEYFVKSEYIAPSLLNPDVNQPVDIDITYTNNGQGNGNSFEVFTQVDNAPHDSVRVDGVLGGQTNTVRMPHTWSSSVRGIHVIRAIVDHDNEIDEPDELNNEATRAIVVGLSPNLKFTAFTVSSLYPSNGTAVTIKATIKNNGYTGIYATYQLFYLDNNNAEVLIRQQAIAVDSAGSIQLTTPWIVNDTRTTYIGRIINANPVEYDATDNEASVEIGKLQLSVSGSDASCVIATDGKAKVTILGGTAPFSKTWSNGMTGDSIIVTTGKYVVTVIDAEGTIVTGDTVVIGAGIAPLVSFTGLADSYIVTDQAVTLTGQPVGGTFSGPGISGDQFNPTSAGVGGPYTISYTYATAAGCGGTVTATTNVFPANSITWFRDADGDGFGNPAISINAASVPAGYVADNTDCDDNDATIYPGAPEICDGKDNNCDGSIDEGFSLPAISISTASTTVCGAESTTFTATVTNEGTNPLYVWKKNGLLMQSGGANTPFDIVNLQDGDVITCVITNASACAPVVSNAITVHVIQPTLYYRDVDGDGYGNFAVSIESCAPVSGYVTNSTDCNDNDAAIHAPVQYYVDNDRDGYGSTTPALLCSLTAPVGYSTNNTDCDDNNANIHAPVQYYVDNDRDGYGSTTTALLCSLTAPVGYSTNNTDCDDNNANIHAPVQYYVDNDRDGYGSTTTALLCSLTAPVGYSTNNTDCNDNNANIHAPVQYYVDNDRDGYGSTTTALLCSLTAPVGYSTNNTDCDDNNANIHAPVQYYVDNDRDGYGSATTALLCSLTAPVGYSTNNTDCDDNNANIHAPVQYYVDNDRDGYGSTTTALLCSLTAPVGYSTNNTDCDDNNANIHVPVQYYVDNDRDGYGSTTTALLCSLTAPVGYSTNNTDCDDNNANIHAPVQYYVDNDRDGYGSTTTALLCSLTAPVGYSTNSTDCNDNNANIHAPVQYYVDNDRDGYGSTTTALLCSLTAPVGYSTNNTDCNDNDVAIHPGATEICDGKDNNCDGQVDEGCSQITMTITDASMTEGDKGKKTMNFDVVISQTSTKAVTVNYSTVNGTATAGSDYTAKTGTLTFKGKTVKQTIGISINGDKIPEPNEVFYINLVNAINAQVVKTTGIGTIVNDDGAVAGNITVADNSSIPSVEAFPNPTSNFLDVRLYGYSGDVTIQLMNGEGKILKQEKLQTTGIKFAQKQFNVASFAGGVYILMVIDEHGSRKIEKVIITR